MATLLHALNDQGQWVPVNLRDLNEVEINNEVEVKNEFADPLPVSHGLQIPEHNYRGLTYTGQNVTQIIYKQGGQNGTTVATQNFVYDAQGNVVSIEVN